MEDGSSFPTTHWSQVARAGGRDGTIEAQRYALETLLRRYRPAFLAHVIHVRRVRAGDADDLVQGFICDRIVAEGLIGKADQARGKFRTYLLTALDRHIVRVRRHDQAAKRGGGVAPAAIDDHDPAAASPTATEIFDIAWARQVMEQGIQEMRKECDEEVRPDIWSVFEARVLLPLLDGAEPTPYRQMVESLGLASTEVAANLTITSKRMFARHLRAVVGQYARGETEIEQEISDLREILGRR